MRIILLGLACAMAITLDAGIACGRSFWSNGAFDSTDAIGLGVVGGRVWTGLHAFDGAAGVGLQLLMEHHFAERYRWDLRLGGFNAHIDAPTEEVYPADAGECAILSTGLHRDLRHRRSATWWAGGEIGLHLYQMRHYGYGAVGAALGPAFGVDMHSPDSRLFTRIGVHLSGLRLDAGSGARGTFVAMVGVDILYTFGRRPAPQPAWPFER